MSFKEKYLKYKNKYLNLKNQIGGSPQNSLKVPLLLPSPSSLPSSLPSSQSSPRQSPLPSPRQSPLLSPSSRPRSQPSPSSRPRSQPSPRQSPLPSPSSRPRSQPSPRQSPRPGPLPSPSSRPRSQPSPQPSPQLSPTSSPPVSSIVSPPVSQQVQQVSPPTCLRRKNSLYFSIQDGDTCFMHAATRMICRLLKNCIPFKISIEQCDAYYSIINCRDVFNCFLKNPCPTLEKDKNYKDRLAEDLSALLFYFIYLKIEEIFKSCDGGNSTIASLYILDFIKYAEINIDTIKTVLNYKEINYEKVEDKEYFNKLMNELLPFLNNVKQKLKKEEFNPICYHMSTTDNFILCDNPKLYYEGDKNLFIPSKTTVIDPNISQKWTYNKIDHNYPFNKDPFNKKPLKILKQILEEGYYATLSIHTKVDEKIADNKQFKHVVIITNIIEDDLVIKNTWNNTSPEAEKKWCPHFKNQKINFFKLIDKEDKLNIKHELKFRISFFYNVPDYKVESFMHTATSLVIQLLKLSFPTFFRDVIQEYDIYYNLTTCNNHDRNIFDYFVDSKNPNWLKENVLALLFHFIFLKIKENYEPSFTKNPKEASFYILYYITNVEISKEKIITLLRYSEPKDTINKTYFEILIDDLFNFFNKVKNKFKFKTFNPIIYSINNKEDEFRINNIIITNPDGKVRYDHNKPQIFSQNKNKIITTWKNTKEYLFNKIKKLETLRIILKEEYYAFLFFNDKLNYLIITEIDNDDNLVVKNKWDRNIPIAILKMWLPFITPDYKISFNELEKSTLEYNITFFYNEYDNRPRSLPITYKATILITQLLKSSFPIIFTNVTQECGFYYNLTTCTNKDANIFDCFLEYKYNKDEYPELVDKTDWLKENFLALLFHFIFKIYETKLIENNWIWAIILDILKYIKENDINRDTVKKVLNYKKTNYKKAEDKKAEDKNYFNKLINKLVDFLNQVKKKIKFKTFNPILYYLDKNYTNFIITYDITFDATTIKTTWKHDSNKYPFINKSVEDTLRAIIGKEYYVGLSIANDQFIITAIDETNNLIIKNTWEKDICYNDAEKKNCKIDLKKLLKSEYTIYFFYNVPGYIPTNCFIHTATILVTQLLKTSFPTYFIDVTQECDLYYNLITCKNKDVTIFDCFLETKSNDDYTMPRDLLGWLKENFVALLFHFIFLKMNETFGENCSYESLIGGALYILKYIEDTEIKKHEVERLLKYESKYTLNIYFNLLINTLYTFLIDVREKLQDRTFKPIIYYLKNEEKDFNAIFNITYTSTPKQGATYKYKKLEKNAPFSNQTLLETLKFILQEKYYAFLEIKNMSFIITSIDDENNLLIKNTWEKDKCFYYNIDLNSLLTNECKINFDKLRKSDLKYSLGFFYNNTFFNPKSLLKNEILHQ